MIGHEKAYEPGMTVTVTATRTVTNPPDTASRIPPPPDPTGVTTAAGNGGRPGPPGGAGLCWPPTACRGMGDWPLRQCRVFARRTGPTSGIWGGLSEEDRGHAVLVHVPPVRRPTPGVPGSPPAAECHVR